MSHSRVTFITFARMRQIAEIAPSTSLNAMWTAYRRSRLGSAESCDRYRAGLRVAALVLVYKTEIRHTESGEGVSAAATTTYGYDYSGQRVFTQTASSTTVFPSKYFSITSTQIASTTYASSTSYIYAGDTLVAYVEQDLIDSVATGTPRTFYVHPDHLGSTNVITGENGEIISSKDYLPYGSVRVENGDASLARGFIGQFEEGNNISYLQNRYYQSDRGQFLSQDPTFLAIGDLRELNRLAQLQQQKLLMDPQALNSYSYARGNPIVNKDPTGLCFEPLSAIACAYTAYTGATLLIDAYDVYQTNVTYGDVFSQEEKNQTNFKAVYDVALTATGAKIARDFGKAAEVGYDTLTAGLDALDTYFGEQIYKKYNENHDPNKKDSPASNSSRSSTSGASSNVQVNNNYGNSSRQGSQYSTPNQGGGGGYGQLVSSLSRLVASLQAYVAGLSGNQNSR